MATAKSLERDMIKLLMREYATALSDIRSVLATFYGKYDMTYQEMNKYNRLQSLEKEVNAHIAALKKASQTGIGNGLGGIFKDGYYRTGFEMEIGVKAKLGYTQIDDKVVIASVQNPISGLKLNDRLEKQRLEILYSIKGNITQSLIQGTDMKGMIASIKSVLENNMNKAIRIAQTESHRCLEEGRRSSIEYAVSQGVVGRYMWIATLDSKTRLDHQSMDGKYADEDGIFTLPDGTRTRGPGLSGVAKQDINCRCDMQYVITGFEPTQRRVTGEGQVPYKTYNQWASAKKLN